MKTIEMQHEFDCSAEVFWQRYLLDEETMTKLMDASDIKSRAVLSHTEDDETIKRDIKQTPTHEMPGFVQRLIGDSSYVEHNVFYKKSKRCDFTIEPSAMKDKTKMKGAMECVDLPGGRCRRSMKMTIEISVFMVGGKIEDEIAKGVMAGYEKAAKWIQQDLKSRPPAA